MKSLISQFAQLKAEQLTYQTIGEMVRAIDVDQLNYKELLPEIKDPSEYSRNILLLEPMELVLLHWPAGVESAVHHHEGFWGYVLVLEGTIDNVEYVLDGTQLKEQRTIRGTRAGIIDEPDGTIHKIVNTSTTDHLITLHFYYPALESLDKLVLYELESGTRGVLNEKAETASFGEPEAHFHELQPGAFEYVPFEQAHSASHRILPILPKPDCSAIKELIGAYYAEQAQEYDRFDQNHNCRSKYTDTINQLIAKEIAEKPQMQHLLSLACGTGRRDEQIRALSKRDYHISGIDLTEEMCSIAQGRGIELQHGDWMEFALQE
jgi:predicted metal-dependent enzyme (double-stranded beta helix superfamily)